jgi:hypothetical protein
LATLPDEQAHRLVAKLLSNNGGCKLPCWWGITPNKSTWDETGNYLRSFTSVETHDPILQNENGIQHTYMWIGVNYQTFQISDPTGFEMWEDNGIISSIFIYKNSAQQFQMPSLLSEYGKPGEVYINTFHSAPGNKVPFSTILYYPERGILAFYLDEEAPINGNYIYFCSKPLRPTLLLWSPDSPERNEEEKNAMFASGEYWKSEKNPYQPLTNVSNMNVDTFYKTFLHKDTGGCIKTSIDKWLPDY